MPAQISWEARLLNATDPALDTESTANKLFSLSCQASDLGNHKLAARLLQKVQQSPVLQANTSMLRSVAFQEACQKHVQPGGLEEALTKLTAIVKGISPAEESQTSEDGRVKALACIELAAWVQVEHSNSFLLNESSSGEVGEYAQLWQACDGKHRTQLQALIAATKLAPQLAAAWAMLSNWLHSRLLDEALEVSHPHTACTKITTALQLPDLHFSPCCYKPNSTVLCEQQYKLARIFEVSQAFHRL